MRKQKEFNMRRLRGELANENDNEEDEAGISWGMGLDDEKEITAF